MIVHFQNELANARRAIAQGHDPTQVLINIGVTATLLIQKLEQQIEALEKRLHKMEGISQ